MNQDNRYTEFYAERDEMQSLELSDGMVSQASHTLQQGVGKREIEDESTRYSYTMDERMPDFFLEGHPHLCDARQSVHGGGVDTDFSFLLGGEDGKSSCLHMLEAVAYSLDPRVVKVKAVVLHSCKDVSILTSESDEAVHDHRLRTALMLNVVLEQDGRHEMGFASEQLQMGAEFVTDERIRRIAERAVAQADHLFRAVTPKGGDLPVVMAAGASGILLHEAIGHAFEADFNRKNMSIFSDKIGQSVCRPDISIVDDGTLSLSSGSFACDDEGIKSQCTYLVRDGRLESYLHDRISARHYGVKPTGNGRRQSFRHVPVPRMTNTYMLAGDATKDDIISSVKHGIYAESFTNGQVQIGAGDFTFFLKTGFLIEDGHLTQPIRDVNIIGNGPSALADISMVGNDLEMALAAGFCGKAGQQIPVGQGIPTVLVDKLTVGGV